jgi:hypothetical protein
MALACVAADGDMAITRYNAVSNLLADCLSGRIDVFAHVRPPLPCFTRPVPSSCLEWHNWRRSSRLTHDTMNNNCRWAIIVTT